MKQYKKFNAGGKYTGVVRNIAVNISVEDIMADVAGGLKRIADEAGLAERSERKLSAGFYAATEENTRFAGGRRGELRQRGRLKIGYN